MQRRSNGIFLALFCFAVLSAAGCHDGRSSEDGLAEPQAEDEIVEAAAEEPPPAACDGPALSVEELHELFEDLEGTRVCVEGKLEAAGCTCVEDWPCTPPDCGTICTGGTGFKTAATTYYFIDSGWECECTDAGSCVQCTPLPCGEAIRIIAVPQVYLDVLRGLAIEEVCFPPLPEP